MFPGGKKAMFFYTFKFLGTKNLSIIPVSVQFFYYTFKKLPKKSDCMSDY